MNKTQETTPLVGCAPISSTLDDAIFDEREMLQLAGLDCV